jgi:hypothetical protein
MRITGWMKGVGKGRGWGGADKTEQIQGQPSHPRDGGGPGGNSNLERPLFAGVRLICLHALEAMVSKSLGGACAGNQFIICSSAPWE